MVAADPTREPEPIRPVEGAGRVERPVWLFGPGLDLWIGCGLAYLLTVPLLIGWTRATGVSVWSIVWIGVFATFVNAPHYGATLVRVYEQPGDRHRYVFFTLWVTLGLVAAFGAGLAWPLIGSALITLYVSWSPWHFSGQNYGLAVMFLGRSGVSLPARSKKWLRTSFFLAFVLALIAVHVETSDAVYAPGASELSRDYRVIRLGLPGDWALGLAALTGAAYLACLFAVARTLLRRASWRVLLPVGALVLTEALWFVVPAVLQLGGGAAAHALPFAAIWISTAHSAQYLWVSAYYAKRSGRHGRTPAFLAKSLVAGSAAIVLPGLLFMPALFGPLAWSAGLATLVFSVVNLHHFLLDGAIWKLRDGPVARALLRTDDVSGAAPIEAPRTPWLRRSLQGLGALCVLVPLVQVFEMSSGLADPGDVARLERATERLRWIGRDSPKAYMKLAAAREDAGLIDPAIEAYRSALALDPDHARAADRLAWHLALHHGDDPARAEEAVALAERASASAGARNPRFLDTLAAAQAAAGRFDDAAATARRAMLIARSRGLRALADDIERRLARYRAGRPVGDANAG